MARKLIFHCPAGAYEACTVAALYLGELSMNRPPIRSELEKLLYFDRICPEQRGHLCRVGSDAMGNEVYILARMGLGKIAPRVLPGIARICGLAPEEILLIDASGPPDIRLSFGGFLSTRLGLPSLGRPLIVNLLRAHFQHYVTIARQTQADVTTMPAPRVETDAAIPLRILYHCYGSAHSSVLASAIHVGLMPSDRRPSLREIMAMPRFDRMEADNLGKPRYIGMDERNVEVFIVGLGSGKILLRRSIDDLLRACGIPSDRLLIINALTQVNTLTRVGGFLSRGLGWVAIGRPLAAIGIWQKYFAFVHLVLGAKEQRDRLLNEPMRQRLPS